MMVFKRCFVRQTNEKIEWRLQKQGKYKVCLRKTEQEYLSLHSLITQQLRVEAKNVKERRLKKAVIFSEGLNTVTGP